MSNSKLFQPLKVGNIQLKNRVAMAPLTRFRASDEHVPLPMVAEYYEQRASAPGTLLITEATFISPEAGGYTNVPGIYNKDQIESWKRVTDAVHKKGSFIYLQLWALGRVARPAVAEQEGFTIKSSSAVRLDDTLAKPQEMTIEDIKSFIAAYAQAAKNAIEAGFDGVEVHGANGYLVDQFIQDNVNKRTDAYGGSVENRSRFALEVTKAVADAIGAEKTGIRLSPFSVFQGMHMDDPIPQFTHVIQGLNEINGLAYIHIVESRVGGNLDTKATELESIKSFVELSKSPVLIAGGFDPEKAFKAVDEEYASHDNVVIVFGRYFISTPDLVFRLEKGIELNPYDRDTFYSPGKAEGYTDYPFSKEFLAAAAA